MKKWFAISCEEMLPNDKMMLTHLVSEDMKDLVCDYLKDKYNVSLNIKEIPELSLTYPGMFRIGEPFFLLEELNLHIRCHDFKIIAENMIGIVDTMPNKNNRTYKDVQFFKTRFFEGVLCLSMNEAKMFRKDLNEYKYRAEDIANKFYKKHFNKDKK